MVLVVMSFVIVLAVVVGIHLRIKSNRAWEEVSERLGFYYDPPVIFGDQRRLEGTYKGKNIRIDTRVEGGGKSKQRFTRYRRQLDDRWSDKVEIRPFTGGLFAGEPQGYRTGHLGFDKEFEVLGRVDREVEAALKDREVLLELQRLSKHYWTFWISEGYLWLEHRKVASEALEMKRKLDRMINLDRSIEAALDAHQNMDVGDWGQGEELFPELDSGEREREPSGVAW